MTIRDLPVTSYALLGLLMFAGRSEAGVTGYELKQRADMTLRYYWVSPAMSQVYTELTKLAGLGLVDAEEVDGGDSERRTTTYRITDDGEASLRAWMSDEPAGFPVLKHPVALRLLMGHLSSPEQLDEMLEGYLAQLAERRKDLQVIRDSLGDDPAFQYPAMVADWGLSYYDSEAEIASSLAARLATSGGTTRATEGDELPTGIGNPARRALANAGYARLHQLTRVRETELKQLHGVGPKALRILREALAAHGWSFADEG